MRKFLKARRRRYGVAIVIVAASLGVLAACNPTKPPPAAKQRVWRYYRHVLDDFSAPVALLRL